MDQYLQVRLFPSFLVFNVFRFLYNRFKYLLAVLQLIPLNLATSRVERLLFDRFNTSSIVRSNGFKAILNLSSIQQP